MYWIPSRLISDRTRFTRSSRPFALTWASRSVMLSPLALGLDLNPQSIRRRTCGAPSTPRERAVGRRMELALREAREAERFEQLARSAAEVLGDELADPDHLVPVVRIRDHVGVVAKAVEHREVVGRETADAARRLLLVKRCLAFE